MNDLDAGKVGILLLVVVLMVGAAVGAAYFFTGSDSSEVGVDPPDPVEASDTPSSSASSDLIAVAEYGWGEVYLELERETDAGSKGGISVYFVNEGRESFAGLTLNCALRYRRTYDAVSCYGFPSLEALEYAEVDRETGGMEHLCWGAYYSVAKGETGKSVRAGAFDAGQYKAEGCPAI